MPLWQCMLGGSFPHLGAKSFRPNKQIFLLRVVCLLLCDQRDGGTRHLEATLSALGPWLPIAVPVVSGALPNTF